jgi:hypothetical protein
VTNCKLLNVTTLGQTQTDNINQIITITDLSHTLITSLSRNWDYINLIT